MHLDGRLRAFAGLGVGSIIFIFVIIVVWYYKRAERQGKIKKNLTVSSTGQGFIVSRSTHNIKNKLCMYSKQVHRKKRKNYRNAFANSDSTQKRYIDPEIEFHKTQRLALIAFSVGLYVGG